MARWTLLIVLTTATGCDAGSGPTRDGGPDAGPALCGVPERCPDGQYCRSVGAARVCVTPGDAIVPCGYSPFPEDGDRCDPGELPAGHVCRQYYCAIYCYPECRCIDGRWDCQTACRDLFSHDCGAPPRCRAFEACIYHPPPDAGRPIDAGMDGGPRGSDIRIDFGTDSPDPPGVWTVLGLADQNVRIEGLVDSVTGARTGVSLSSVRWVSTSGDPSNWRVGDVDWLVGDAARDGWAGITGSVIRLEGLAGIVRVEIVSASAVEIADQSITVNGETTDLTALGRGVDSAAWSPRDDGTLAADWLVWPALRPTDGAVEIIFAPGLVSALRVRTSE